MKFNLLQSFIVMQAFLSKHYSETKSNDISIVLTTLVLWAGHENWRDDPNTFDQSGWEDWMKSVNEVLLKQNIKGDPRDILFDTGTVFLFMYEYLSYFYIRFDDFNDVGDLLLKLKRAESVKNDIVWGKWIEAVKDVFNGTYELDIFFVEGIK